MDINSIIRDYLLRNYVHLLMSNILIKECLHPWVRVDQAGRHLPPKILSILVGLTLKLVSLCSIISILEKIWMVYMFGRC